MSSRTRKNVYSIAMVLVMLLGVVFIPFDIYKAAELKIVNHPDTQVTSKDVYVTFSVEASGDGLAYQWQYKASYSPSWYNSSMEGSNTDTLMVQALESRNGYQYRCVVTDKNGNSVSSDGAYLFVADGDESSCSIVVPFSYQYSGTINYFDEGSINKQVMLGEEDALMYSKWSFFTLATFPSDLDYIACKVSLRDVVFEHDTDLGGNFYYNAVPYAEYSNTSNACLVRSNGAFNDLWVSLDGDNRYHGFYLYYEMPFNYVGADYIDIDFSGNLYIEYYSADMLLTEFWAELKPYIDNLESIENTTLIEIQSLVTQANNIYKEQLEQGKVLDSLYSVTQLINSNLDSIEDYLASIDTELEKHTSWLEKIWQGIMQLVEPDEESKDKVEDSKDKIDNQNSEIDNLLSDMQIQRPDVENIKTDIQGYLPVGSIDSIRELLSVITENEIIKMFIIVSFSMALVGYIFFGKR